MTAAIASLTPIAEDGFFEDRVTCGSCRNRLPWSGKCREQERYGPVIVDLPRRCTFYAPIESESDQRTGAQRWPGLAEEIEEMRQLDQGAKR